MIRAVYYINRKFKKIPLTFLEKYDIIIYKKKSVSLKP